MKVFNLTDVETPTLKQYGLVNQIIVVKSVLVRPGESVEAKEDHGLLAALQHFTTVGALAVGTLPPSYVVAKEKKRSKERAEAQAVSKKKEK